MLDAASELPGVVSAAYANSIPLSMDQSGVAIFNKSAAGFDRSERIGATAYDVSPGYFRTMRTRLIAGRDFNWHDDATGRLIAIVNQRLARQLTRKRDAVGQRFRYARGDPLIEIIGVVEDGKYESLLERPRGAVFRPILQSFNPATVVLLRSTRPESEIAGELRQVITGFDRSLPVYAVGSLIQMLGFAFFPARAATIALGSFALLAVMLAITGVYGVATYAVSRRIQEIGIRIAVEATPTQVLRFVLGRTAVLLVTASVIGFVVSIAATKVLSSIVYQASSQDPLILIAAAATMALIGIGAAGAPARRALSIDPLSALRHE